MPSRIHRRRAGFTLIETLLAVTLLLGLVLLVSLASRQAGDAFKQGAAEEALNSKAHRVLERQMEAFEEAERVYRAPALLPPAPPAPPGLLDLAEGDSTVTYHVPVGFAGGIILWGPDTQIVLEYDPNELDDGIDNDGDGLVDEGQVVWIENPGVPGERRVVLCRGVPEDLEGEIQNLLDDNGNGLIDERGFSLDVQGQVLTMRLTLQALDPAGRLLTKTVQSSVRIRN